MDAAEGDREAVLSRHRKETRELENKSRFMLKQAKKAKKNEIEAEIKALETALKQRHEEELAAFPVGGDGGGDDAGKEAAAAEEESSDDEPDTARSKREKAKRKKDRKAEKELERQRAKAEILENAGPSMRDIELEDLSRKLRAENLEVAEIAADGNCLYRAIVHQLKLPSAPKTVFDVVGLGRAVDSSTLTHEALRIMCADYMRQHREDYEPFLNAEDSSDARPLSFEEYCEQVASPVAAVWGGQLELRAIAAALERPIWVYDALQPTIRMGEGESEPIRLSFHRHFYSLGEHYNSVVTKSM